MYSLGLLLLVLLACIFTGTVSFPPHYGLPHHAVDSSSKRLDIFYFNSENLQGNFHQATQYISKTQEFLWKKDKNIEHSTGMFNSMRHSYTNSLSSTGTRKRRSKSGASYRKRFKRATSKFTGLVVGASKDSKLKEAVMKTINQVEAVIWSFQGQYSKPFIAGQPGPAVLLGTFNSEFRTNFHGNAAAVQLRRSDDFCLYDLNSLATLLILQCLVEASLYGNAIRPAASNTSVAVESLKSFYTHTYPTGSSILTMWREKLINDGKEWVNLPEYIRGANVKDNTTFQQLQQLAKTCNCEPAKTALQEMSENKLCKDHFATPLSDLYKDTATPPDFMTSFSNLALGSLLQTKFPTKNSGVFKAESQIWLSGNNDLKILINKLKSSVIIFPAKYLEILRNGSLVNKRENISDLQEEINNTRSNELLIRDITSNNVTADNITTLSNDDAEFQGSRGSIRNNTKRNVIRRSLDANRSDGVGSVDEVSQETSESGNIPNTQTFTKSENLTVMLTTTTVSTTTVQPATTTTTAQPTTTITVQPTTATTITRDGPVKVDNVPINIRNRTNQIISSESYYGIRGYLDAVLPEGNEEVILIPSLISDDVNSTKNGTGAPYNDGNIWRNGKLYQGFNKVNLMTTATTIHALVASSLSGLIDITNDTMLQRIVVASLRLLTWYMNNTQETATMVTLSQFPSRYQVYWVTSRIAFQLNSKQAEATKMFQFADEVITAFVRTLRDRMTFAILQSIIDDGLGPDGKTRVFIDDFIGTADFDDKGKKLVGGDDRLFTSSLAVNALIATWTVQDDSGLLHFVTDITDPVRIAINSMANYIVGVVVQRSVHDQNAFMSEQVKNCKTLPEWYPANMVTTADGKDVNPQEPKLDLRFGVKGYISREDYQHLLDKPKFGFHTRGVGLEDLNSPTSVFRFWSSPAYTKAAALLAIAQAANLQVDGVK